MNMLAIVLIVGLAVAYLLYAWFKKNTFVEYMEFFALEEWCLIPEFRQISECDKSLLYTNFLAEYYNSCWFVRLITCPVCLAFWLALPLTVIAVLGTNISWFMLATIWPASAYASLFLYVKLVKLLSND